MNSPLHLSMTFYDMEDKKVLRTFFLFRDRHDVFLLSD